MCLSATILITAFWQAFVFSLFSSGFLSILASIASLAKTCWPGQGVRLFTWAATYYYDLIDMLHYATKSAGFLNAVHFSFTHCCLLKRMSIEFNRTVADLIRSTWTGEQPNATLQRRRSFSITPRPKYNMVVLVFFLGWVYIARNAHSISTYREMRTHIHSWLFAAALGTYIHTHATISHFWEPSINVAT